jgi:hypothetical protein
MFDIALFLYIWTSLACWYGFALFLWWWYKVKRASKVYAYMTFLLAGIGYATTMAGVSRVYFLTGNYDFVHNLLASHVWEYRLVPMSVILTVIVVRMTLRIKRNDSNS